MADLPLELAAEERDYLANVLETLLKQKMIEEHRTRSLSYRPIVAHEEELIRRLLEKLGKKA
jgi:hypothetical protein